MPAEQVIGFASVKFSKIKTLVINQSTHLVKQDDQGPEKVIKETLWLKAPGYLYSKIEDEIGAGSMSGSDIMPIRPSPDMAFRRLFMGHSRKGLMMLLSAMGINLESVSYTRLDGVIAYQIGDGYAGGPKLLIEKETFLPLLIRYRIAGDAAPKIVTVRFEEYKKFAEGWYPYQISYSVGEDILERYSVIDLQVNVPIEQAVFEDRGAGAPTSHAPAADCYLATIDAAVASRRDLRRVAAGPAAPVIRCRRSHPELTRRLWALY